MFSSAVCFLLLHTLVLQAYAVDLAWQHSFFAPLDEDQNVKLYWNVSFAEKQIFFTVEAKTTGWIGFGISSGQGKMKGADIVIGWVKDGKAYFKDRHADGHMMPKIDTQQDYELISLTEDNGKTTMKFKRKFDTCDPEDNKIEQGTTKVIYAYHPDDPSSENVILQHSRTNRGPRSVLLLSSFKKPALPPDTKQFDITHNKTTIPKDSTSYICAVFEIPKVNEMLHIVMYEPVIQPGHEGVVHHILVYECSDDFPKHHLNYTGHCYASNMPPPIRECAGITSIAGWAVGGEAFYFPEHAGFPIGKADSPKVVILEIHYDNPMNKEGMIDSSGLRFHYTKQLRKYDAGLLTLGATVSRTAMVIPPRQTDWEINGFCSAECTRVGLKGSTLPKGGINVFSPLLHTHLAGRKAYIRHIRDGVELPEIARDNHYDFNFQEYRILNKEVHIAPGDSLINVCVYDTKDRTLSTTGGLRTYDEMCLSFLTYYPKVNFTQCRSSEWPAVQDWAKHYVKNLEDTKNPNFWTDSVNKGLKDAYRETDQVYVHCHAREGKPLPGLEYRLEPKPVIKTPYKPESSCQVFGSMDPEKNVEKNSTGIVTTSTSASPTESSTAPKTSKFALSENKGFGCLIAVLAVLLAEY